MAKKKQKQKRRRKGESKWMRLAKHAVVIGFGVALAKSDKLSEPAPVIGQYGATNAMVAAVAAGYKGGAWWVTDLAIGLAIGGGVGKAVEGIAQPLLKAAS